MSTVVVSSVPFDRCDVDHVVLAPRGVFAVEVKFMMGQPQPLGRVRDLDLHAAQAKRMADRVRRFLAQHGIDGRVHPVLVLAGPGAPDLAGKPVRRADGLVVVAFRDSDYWTELLVRATPRTLEIEHARVAANALLNTRRPVAPEKAA